MPVLPSILGHRAVVNHGKEGWGSEKKEGWGSENPMPESSGSRLRLWETILAVGDNFAVACMVSGARFSRRASVLVGLSPGHQAIR